jgi:hypothetical protein
MIKKWVLAKKASKAPIKEIEQNSKVKEEK